mmetsp:Transcript_6898/g.14227  ORF Transcript_6898/g.14227 Transcript_6898/m.14227 type:complete len:83 (+) Transcript_6898:2124-2372(+)
MYQAFATSSHLTLIENAVNQLRPRHQYRSLKSSYRAVLHSSFASHAERRSATNNPYDQGYYLFAAPKRPWFHNAWGRKMKDH